MTENELRALATDFFDAIERRDVEAIADLYAPGMTFWINITGQTRTREESLKATAEGYARHRRRTYNDRQIHTFDGGFLMQYTLNIVQLDGAKSSLWACIVALCGDGKITRIDEYIDSGKFAKPAAPASK